MRLSAADLGLHAQRSTAPAQPLSARLGAWHDALAAANVPSAPTTPAVQQRDSVELSAEGQAKSLTEPAAQRKQVLELLDTMFGITTVKSLDLKIDVSHARGASQTQAMRDDGSTSIYAESFRAYAQTSLSAAGTITLDDGRTFNLDLQYQRTVAFASDVTVTNQSAPPTPNTFTVPDAAAEQPVPSWLALLNTTGVTAQPPASEKPGTKPSLLSQISQFLRELQAAAKPAPQVDLRA